MKNPDMGNTTEIVMNTLINTATDIVTVIVMITPDQADTTTVTIDPEDATVDIETAMIDPVQGNTTENTETATVMIDPENVTVDATAVIVTTTLDTVVTRTDTKTAIMMITAPRNTTEDTNTIKMEREDMATNTKNGLGCLLMKSIQWETFHTTSFILVQNF